MTGKPNENKERAEIPIVAFESARAWAKWLEKNYSREPGIWLRFFKKNSGVKTVVYAEALDEALCYGWIDGQLKRYDEQSYLQKFTPRRPRSIWSKRNIEHVTRLTAVGRMKESGLKQVQAAQADGRWERAYAPPSAMEVPDDFLKALAKNKKALKTFDQLNKANRYAIAWRLQNARKPETRQRRLESMINLLAEGKKLY